MIPKTREQAIDIMSDCTLSYGKKTLDDRGTYLIRESGVYIVMVECRDSDGYICNNYLVTAFYPTGEVIHFPSPKWTTEAKH